MTLPQPQAVFALHQALHEYVCTLSLKLPGSTVVQEDTASGRIPAVLLHLVQAKPFLFLVFGLFYLSAQHPPRGEPSFR